MLQRHIRWCVTALLALVTLAHSAPSQAADPAIECATAALYVQNGHLTEAAALYTPAAGETPLPCSAAGLKDVSDKRMKARDFAVKGQKKLRAGEPEEARFEFGEALKSDVGNTEALDGLAEIDAQEVRSAERRWNRFYNDWIVPALQLIVPFAITFVVLLSLSGLLSRWLVGVDSVAWPREVRKPLGIVGWVLLAGTAAMLPVYTMFPFEPEALVPKPSFWSLFALLLSAPISVAAADLLSREWRRPCSWVHWLRFLTCMVGLGIIGLLVTALLPDGPEREQRWLIAAYALLAAYAVLLAATVHGQNRVCRTIG
ncbi:hypothetical protein [Streptomyces sp. NPDC000410]|uniref:hypothetical protein n=1 Tax=Streptomyces sp. NPDC000410 TaxID=3154254 RepID=UPI00332F6303